MIPGKNQKVKIWLKNNFQLEGYVENWSKDEIVLLSNDKLAYLVINKPLEEIIFYKISLRDKNTVEKEIEEKKEKPIVKEEQLKDLAELKKQKNKLEREEYFERMKANEIVRDINQTYGQNISIPLNSPAINLGKKDDKHTRKEVKATIGGIGSELSNLFGKKPTNS